LVKVVKVLFRQRRPETADTRNQRKEESRGTGGPAPLLFCEEVEGVEVYI